MDVARVLLSARFGNYDVIYLHGQTLAPLAAIWLKGPLFGRKLVYHNSDYYDPFCYPIHFALERSLCRKSDLYVNNEFHRGYITKAMYRTMAPVFTAPINLPRAWPVPPRSEELRAEVAGGARDAFVLIMHSGYHELRMGPQLLEAMARLPSRFHLVMCHADMRRAEVDSTLRRLGIEGRVHRLPAMRMLELLRYTVNADAGILLYPNNDLGNFFTAPGRLTEYLVCGLPVVATDHTGLDSLVGRYQLGVTVDSVHPDKLADKIMELECGIRQGAFAADRLRKVFEQHFAFDWWEPSVVRLFDDLVNGRLVRSGCPPEFPWMINP
jgi:glycosyltransferase involved in cell wall biosynthesis